MRVKLVCIVETSVYVLQRLNLNLLFIETCQDLTEAEKLRHLSKLENFLHMSVITVNVL